MTPASCSAVQFKSYPAVPAVEVVSSRSTSIAVVLRDIWRPSESRPSIRIKFRSFGTARWQSNYRPVGDILKSHLLQCPRRSLLTQVSDCLRRSNTLKKFVFGVFWASGNRKHLQMNDSHRKYSTFMNI